MAQPLKYFPCFLWRSGHQQQASIMQIMEKVILIYSVNITVHCFPIELDCYTWDHVAWRRPISLQPWIQQYWLHTFHRDTIWQSFPGLEGDSQYNIPFLALTFAIRYAVGLINSENSILMLSLLAFMSLIH